MKSGHVRTILRDLGALLHIPGAMALLSMPVALVAGETNAILAFLLTAAIAVAAGQILYRSCRHAGDMGLRHAMFTVVASWLLMSLVGLLPFVLLAYGWGNAQSMQALAVFQNVWNALFEAMSGFTSTGLSMVEHPSELPVSLQWWRTFMEWVGGVGIIVVMLTVFHPAGDSHRLFFAEEGHETISAGDVVATARRTGWIFAGYTITGIGMLRASGMSWWEATNYGMTGIATGGFGVTDQSLGDFGAGPRLVVILLMLLGAISFSIHHRILAERRWRELWRAPENRLLAALIVLGTLVVGLENAWAGSDAGWLDALFQFTSALTTSGFSTVDLAAWSPSALLVLCAAMWCGGDAGATTGGLKLERIVLLASRAFVRLKGLVLHPWRLMKRERLADEPERTALRLEAALVMAFLWATAIVLGTFLLLHAAGPGVALDHVLLEASSALGNAGLTTGITSPELEWWGKLGVITLMWMGRVEIVPLLVVLVAIAGGRRRWRHRS